MKETKMILFPDKGRRWVTDFQKGDKARIRHREDGPAVIAYDGSQYWYQNNILTRKNGPAIVLPKARQYDSKPMHGYQAWFKNGVIHREVGKPSQLWATGDLDFYVNGKLHREDGPAVIRNTPEKEIQFWLNGEQLTFMCKLDKDGNYDKSELDKLPSSLQKIYEKWTESDTMAEISLYHKEAVEFMKEAHRFNTEVGKMVHKTEDDLDDEESDEDVGSFDDEDLKEAKLNNDAIERIEGLADVKNLANLKKNLDIFIKNLAQDAEFEDHMDGLIKEYLVNLIDETINRHT